MFLIKKIKTKYILLISLLLILLLWAFFRSVRTLEISASSTITSTTVKELDALQTTNGTLIMASMEQVDSGEMKYQCAVYRSHDLGETWENTFILKDTSSYTRQYADPRLVEDKVNHRIYLVLMRVRFKPPRKLKYQIPKKPYQSDLVLYQSEDDGKNWTYLSSPHIDSGDVYADLPYLAIDDLQCLLLISSHLNLKYLSGASEIVLLQSCDGGKTWPENYTYMDSTWIYNRKNLGNIQQIGGKSLASVFSDDSKLYFSSLVYKDAFQLKNMIPIAHPFTHKGLPIAFLYAQQKSNQFGIICYLPHRYNSPIWYASSQDGGNSWNWEKISDKGAYPNVLIGQDGTVHLTFSRKIKNTFELMYTFSRDGGSHFSKANSIYTGKFQYLDEGEYQSLFQDQDGKLHLIFCDWADGSKAKHLAFTPE